MKMKMKVTSLSLASALIAASACAPSIDPAAKADVDRKIAAFSPSGPAFPAPTAFEPMPPRAGQWTQHKLVDDKGQPSLMTYKFLGEEAGAQWMEVVTEAYTGRTAMKMLVFLGDRRNPDIMEVRAVKMKDAKGQVTDIEPATLRFMQSLWKGNLSTLVISWQNQPQEDATVPAGAFTGCYKIRTDAAYGPWKSATMTWSHPSVPISGLVRSKGLDKPTTMELVAFGEGGAASEFP